MFVSQGHGGVPACLETHPSGKLSGVVVIIGTVVHISYPQLGHLVDCVRQVLLCFTRVGDGCLNRIINGNKRKKVRILEKKSNRLEITVTWEMNVRNRSVFGHCEETAVFELL